MTGKTSGPWKTYTSYSQKLFLGSLFLPIITGQCVNSTSIVTVSDVSLLSIIHSRWGPVVDRQSAQRRGCVRRWQKMVTPWHCSVVSWMSISELPSSTDFDVVLRRSWSQQMCQREVCVAFPSASYSRCYLNWLLLNYTMSRWIS